MKLNRPDIVMRVRLRSWRAWCGHLLEPAGPVPKGRAKPTPFRVFSPARPV